MKKENKKKWISTLLVVFLLGTMLQIPLNQKVYADGAAGSLTVTVGPGTVNGSTEATIGEVATATFAVNVTDNSVTVPNVGDLAPTSGTNYVPNYTSGDDITTGVMLGKYIQVYDVDVNGHVVNFYEQQLTGGNINSTTAPVLQVTTSPGIVNGSTEATIGEVATATFAVNVTDNSVTVPNVGDPAPTANSNYVSNYISGNNIIHGVANGAYLQVYDLDLNNKVVKFTEMQLTDACIKMAVPGPSAVTSVAVSPSSASIAQGGTKQLTATVNGGTTQAVSWSSSDTSNKVTVGSTGVVSVASDASTTGTYTITATSTEDNTKTSSATITVTAISGASTAPNAADVTVKNYVTGLNDKITVANVTTGAVINVYDAASNGNLIGTATEAGGNSVSISAQLLTTGGAIYVTETAIGKSESTLTPVTYDAEPIPWNIYDHTGNWNESYTNTINNQPGGSILTPIYPNGDSNSMGYQYNKHIIVKNNGSRISFYGYGVPGYTDFIYLPSDSPSEKTFNFNVDVSTLNFHSMVGAGVLFNTTISNGNNPTISGYALLYTSDNKFTLYKLDNVDVNTLHGDVSFNAPGVINTNMKFTPSAGNPHSIILKTTATTLNLWDNGTQIATNTTLPSTNGVTYGNGLGFVAAYLSHGCHILSYFTITNVSLQGIAYTWPILDLVGERGASGTANLTFSAPTGADIVKIQQSTDGINFTDSTLTTGSSIPTSSTSASVTGLDNTIPYYFRLIVGGGGNGGTSNVAYVPTQIGDLAATGGDKSADLTFTAPTGATNVIVQKSTDGINYTTATATPSVIATSTATTVTGLTNGQKYYFRLSVTGGIYAGFSNVAIATPGTAVPITDLAATGGDTIANLTFTAPTGATNVDLQQSTDGVNFVTSTTKDPITSSSNGATVTGLTNGQTYTFRLVVTGGAHDGTSNTANAIPLHVSTGNPTVTPTETTTIKGDVVDNKSGQSVKNVDAKVTTETNGNKTVTVKANDTVLIKKPDGTKTPITDLTKLGFVPEKATNSNVTVSSDGSIEIKNVAKGEEAKYDMTYDLGNGQKIKVGTMKVTVSSTGEISFVSTLIDPYGIITDARTGKAIQGVNVTLYYANTARNIAAGKTPGSIVPLPELSNFEPNSNKNPQLSDVSGAYAFMVFPTSDYYIVGTKDGYEQYKSMIISVEQDIVKWDFKMTAPIAGIKRISGANRVDTAIEIAKANFTGKISNVIFATADNYPDALAGSVLAYKLNAPILLVGSSDVDQQKVIDYLKTSMDTSGTVYILGGTGVVTSQFQSKVASNGYTKITRLGGKDRVETALKISDNLDVKSGTPLILVDENSYPDALSISSAAAAMQSPILLIDKNNISDAVKAKIAAIKPIKVYIIGLQGVLSSAIETQVAQITSLNKNNIIRIGGNDRYNTSLEVAKYFGLSGQNISIATGNDFPDALAGSIYAANNNSPIILTNGTLTDDAKAYISSRKPIGATIFGGESVVNKTIEQELSSLIATN